VSEQDQDARQQHSQGGGLQLPIGSKKKRREKNALSAHLHDSLAVAQVYCILAFKAIFQAFRGGG